MMSHSAMSMPEMAGDRHAGRAVILDAIVEVLPDRLDIERIAADDARLVLGLDEGLGHGRRPIALAPAGDAFIGRDLDDAGRARAVDPAARRDEGLVDLALQDVAGDVGDLHCFLLPKTSSATVRAWPSRFSVDIDRQRETCGAAPLQSSRLICTQQTLASGRLVRNRERLALSDAAAHRERHPSKPAERHLMKARSTAPGNGHPSDDLRRGPGRDAQDRLPHHLVRSAGGARQALTRRLPARRQAARRQARRARRRRDRRG